ncbi:hypothetical protein EDP1_1204 [Pseudomonas putida S610]|nr:hypothetical protein EDP1_1204 [Pseudomonas putida S610]
MYQGGQDALLVVRGEGVALHRAMRPLPQVLPPATAQVPVEAALCRDRPPGGLEAITLSESTNVPLASL